MKTKLIILAVLVVVLGGGWYYYKNLSLGTSDWKTYTNTEYGFELKFPPSWEGYRISRAENGDGSSSVDFFIPTWGSSGTDNPETVGLLVILTIYPRSLYELKDQKDLHFEDKSLNMKFLDGNDQYVFFYTLQDPPSESPTYRDGQDIYNPNIEQAIAEASVIIKTFKFTK